MKSKSYYDVENRKINKIFYVIVLYNDYKSYKNIFSLQKHVGTFTEKMIA